MSDNLDENSDENPNPKLTDLEELELRRRFDIALGVLPRAIELFELRKECRTKVKAAEPKTYTGLVLLLSALILIAAHIIVGKGGEFTSAPGVIALIPLGWLWVITQGKITAGQNEAMVQDKLMALSVTFYGATADWGEFWRIDEFSDVSSAGRHGFDAEDDRVRKWLFRVRLSIVQNLCGLDDFDRRHALCTKLCRDYGYDEDQYYWNE